MRYDTKRRRTENAVIVLGSIVLTALLMTSCEVRRPADAPVYTSVPWLDWMAK